MKRAILLTVLILAMGNTGIGNAQSPSKVVTPPAAAETTRATGDAIEKSVKDALKTDEKEKKAKRTMEQKRR